MLQYHTHGVLQGCKGVLCCLYALPAAGAIVGLHRLVTAREKNHDDADNQSAAALCTKLHRCRIIVTSMHDGYASI